MENSEYLMEVRARILSYSRILETIKKEPDYKNKYNVAAIEATILDLRKELTMFYPENTNE